MSTLAMTHTLAAIFVPVGIAGAIIAVICALIMAFALARRAAGLAGGAAGVWIVGALLSWASSFSDLWLPLFISLGALAGALVIGTLLRVVVASVRRQEAIEPSARTTSVQEPRTQPARVTSTRSSAPVTDGIRAAA